MSSRTHRDQGPSTAQPPSVPADFPPEPAGATPGGGRDHRRPWGTVVLVVALVAALAASGYLLAVARAWEERAGDLEATAHGLGGELGEVQAQLDEAHSTLALVESQLDGAQEQIHELADVAARTGDDREVQRQVAEYQGELFATATAVTGTMGECITDQNEYILALEEDYVRLRDARDEDADEDDEEQTETPSPTATETEEPVDLGALRADAVRSCAAAAEAHEGLQERLDDA